MFRVFPPALLLLILTAASCNEREEAGNAEIELEAERTAVSKVQQPRDIQPYDDALTWQEYRVKRVLSGTLKPETIRVAHWSVVAAKPVEVGTALGEVVKLSVVPFDSVQRLEDVSARDDLELSVEEPPRFLDLSQRHFQSATPEALRFDYRGNVSDQMRLYWKLRGQLRIVAMGNSHATKGVCPRSIGDAQNWRTPTVLNMAPAGSNNRQHCLMLREYAKPLPKLEWVLWVVSARSFNAERKDERKYEEFTTSPGWLHDQRHKEELWPVPAGQQPVTADELLTLGITSVDIWGRHNVGKSKLPADLAQQRRLVMAECDSRRFTWGETIFAEFCATARELSAKGIKVMVFTTPLHPFTREAAASDPDGTTHEGFREMVRHMEDFDARTPGVWFRDFHRDGDHAFSPGEFYDVDHLNRAGAGRLGLMIKDWMGEVAGTTAAAQ